MNSENKMFYTLNINLVLHFIFYNNSPYSIEINYTCMDKTFYLHNLRLRLPRYAVTVCCGTGPGGPLGRPAGASGSCPALHSRTGARQRQARCFQGIRGGNLNKTKCIRIDE